MNYCIMDENDNNLNEENDNNLNEYNHTNNYIYNNYLNIIRNALEDNQTSFSDIFNNEIMNVIINNSLNYTFNYNNSVQNVIENSLYDELPYKNVTSDTGLKELKTIVYNGENCVNNSCPITLEPLNIGEEYTILPCNHAFNNDSIINWLKNQSNMCPVCRLKLDYVEKKNNNNNNINNSILNDILD